MCWVQAGGDRHASLWKRVDLLLDQGEHPSIVATTIGAGRLPDRALGIAWGSSCIWDTALKMLVFTAGPSGVILFYAAGLPV